MTAATYDKFRLGRRPAAFAPELKSHKATPSSGSPFTAIAAFFRRLVAAVLRANQRKVLHQQLIALDDHLLADIGLRRAEIPRVVAESYRTYTRAPQATTAETRPDPLTVGEDLPVMDVPANDAEAPRAA